LRRDFPAILRSSKVNIPVLATLRVLNLHKLRKDTGMRMGSNP